MSDQKIGLDNPVFNGRYKQFGRGSYMSTRPKVVAARMINDIKVRQMSAEPKPASRPDIEPEYINVASYEPARIANTSSKYTSTPALAKPSVASPAVRPPVSRLSRSAVIQRNIAPKPQAAKHRRPFLNAQRIVLGMAVVVFLAGLGVALTGFRENRNVEALMESVTEKSPVPKETKPSDTEISSYSVAADQPKLITIKKLGIRSRIYSMGQDSKGNLMSPVNVHDAGWYNQSSKPGQAGAMLIDGHVHGPTTPGVFQQLKNLAVGDVIEVERGDGQTFSYKVVTSSVSPVHKTDMTKAMLPIKAGQSGLNLITCTGQFDEKTGDYPDRLVIYASEI